MGCLVAIRVEMGFLAKHSSFGEDVSEAFNLTEVKVIGGRCDLYAQKIREIAIVSQVEYVLQLVDKVGDFDRLIFSD